MSLLYFDPLTPLVPKATTSVTFSAKIQPPLLVCYINISFALHPSHLWRLQTSLDRDCPPPGLHGAQQKQAQLLTVLLVTSTGTTQGHPGQPDLAQGFLPP